MAKCYEMNGKQKRALTIKAKKILSSMPTKTEAQKTRYENAKRIYENRHTDICGWYGRFIEVVSTPEKINRKTRVSKQGKTDNYIKVRNENGKVCVFACEVKTNSGRITDDLLTKQFVIYEIDMCNSTTNNVHRQSGKRVMTVTAFISILNTCKAIKEVTGTKHRGTNEKAIQGSSKKLFNAICCYPIYDENAVYDIDTIN